MRRWIIIAAIALGACSGDDGGSSRPTAGVGFVPAPAPSGVSVSLEERELGADRLVIDVVANGAADLYGAAFRLKYDPAVLAFSKLEPASGWGSAPPIVLSNAAEPGLLVAVLSNKGKSAGVSGAKLPLATITFQLVKKEATSLELLATRSALVSAKGKNIDGVSWAGGALEKQ